MNDPSVTPVLSQIESVKAGSYFESEVILV